MQHTKMTDRQFYIRLDFNNSKRSYRYSELINQFPVEPFKGRISCPCFLSELFFFYLTAFNQASAISEMPDIDGCTPSPVQNLPGA